MPGDDADFAAYLAARWPSLVRTLVLLGCGRREAVEVAQTGLAQCYGVWERVRRADDVDDVVHAAVLRALRRRRRRSQQPPAEPAPAEEQSEAVVLRRALEEQLTRLDVEHREPLVLRFVGDLSEPQIADVLDAPIDSVRARITYALSRIDLDLVWDRSGLATTSPGGVPHPRPPAAEIFRLASESIQVFAPSVTDVVAEAGARRRRRHRTIAVAALAAVLVAAGIVWLAGRGPSTPQELAPATVTHEPNPVAVAWYADGRLHLAKVAVRVPALTDLVELNGGAAYGDHGGTVAFVAADGKRRRLGQKDAGPLLASAGDGWVAWVRPDPGGGAPAVVVYDLSVGRTLDTLDVSATGVRLIAIDQRRVFYEDADGTFVWAPGTSRPEELERDGLVDVASATRLYQLPGRIEIVQSFFNVSYVRAGLGGRLSAGGSFVLTKVPGTQAAAGRPFRPLVYDARSGHRLPSGLAADERAVDATFGGDHSIVYLVTPVADLAGGSDLDGNRHPLVVLRTCDAGSGRCTDVTPVRAGTDRPLLAR